MFFSLDNSLVRKGRAVAKSYRQSNSLAKLRPIATESPQPQMHCL